MQEKRNRLSLWLFRTLSGSEKVLNLAGVVKSKNCFEDPAERGLQVSGYQQRMNFLITIFYLSFCFKKKQESSF